MPYRAKTRSPLFCGTQVETFQPLFPAQNWATAKKILVEIATYEGMELQNFLKIRDLLFNAWKIQNFHEQPRAAGLKGLGGKLSDPVAWLQELRIRAARFLAYAPKPLNFDDTPALRGPSLTLCAMLLNNGWDGKDLGRLSDCAYLAELIEAKALATITSLKSRGVP